MHDLRSSNHSSSNLLLGSLPPRVLRALGVHENDHATRAVLIAPDETPKSLFFPHFGAVVSIVRATESGAMIEAGVVGHEGALSVHTILAKPAATRSEAVLQISGRVSRVGISQMQDVFGRDARFRENLLSFSSLFLHQVTQNLVCNRLHAIEQRLAKWLLVVRDRIDTDELHLTQDLLSHMLGVHRPGVSIAISALEVDGLISHGRGYVRIRDRADLIGRSCECYSSLHADLESFKATI